MLGVQKPGWSAGSRRRRSRTGASPFRPVLLALAGALSLPPAALSQSAPSAPARASAAGAAKKAPVRPAPARRRPSRVVLPPNAAPVISVTSPVSPYREAEARLALFVSALQRNRRERAAGFFSSRVPARDRQAFQSGRWLRRSGSTAADLNRVLFHPDLQIRTTNKRYQNLLMVAVTPREIPDAGLTQAAKNQKQRRAARRRKSVAGYLEVPMRRERGDWWVELKR